MDDLAKIKYGFWVVLAGLLVVLLVYAVAVMNWKAASDVAAVVSSASAVVGTIVGAFFGVQVGSAGKEKAEEQRDKAQAQAQELAAALPPEQYRSLAASRKDLFGAS
jgi:vacuolar-type H+-ATPase subunit I/STV1